MIHNRIRATKAKCTRSVCACACVRVRNAWMLSRTRVKMFAQVHPRTGMQARYNKGCIMKDTQWWCRGADFNRIMSTDRRDSTELFRVNAPPTPERKLLMETGQLPLSRTHRLIGRFAFYTVPTFAFFFSFPFFLIRTILRSFFSLSFLRLRRISRDYKS